MDNSSFKRIIEDSLLKKNLNIVGYKWFYDDLIIYLSNDNSRRIKKDVFDKQRKKTSKFGKSRKIKQTLRGVHEKKNSYLRG